MSASARKNTEFQQLFSFDWQFSLGDMRENEARLGAGEWRDVQLPHDWSIEYPYDTDPEEHGICSYVVRGVGWYRKSFELPADARGRRLTLLFEGCYMDTTVYVNGRKAGEHFCGYTPFEVDITDFVLPEGTNVVTVRVDNTPQPNSRWYTGSGLYRDVWLLALDPVHVAADGTQLILEELKEFSASYEVRTDLVNETEERQYVILRSSVYDGDRYLLGYPEGCVLEPNETKKVSQNFYLDRPVRWSPREPKLYTLKTEVFRDGEVIDEYNTVFGVRQITFDPMKGMFINGEHVKLLGAAVHQEGGLTGAAVPKKVWSRRIGRLKECGFNGIRTGHNPLIEVCDELGMLVLDEAFDEWKVIKDSKSRGDPGIIPRGYGERFETEYEKDITAFVLRDRNHPCVAIWSSGNEIPDQDQKSGVERCEKIVELFHRLDPTRPVTLALDRVQAEPGPALEEFINRLDIVGYNYVDRWRLRNETFYDEDKLAHPEWIQLGTEHSPVHGAEQGTYTIERDPGKFFSMPYWCQPVDPSELLRYTLTHDFVVGDYLWTGVDYLGEARWPDRVGSHAVLDSCGYPRDAFWFYKSVLTDCEPMIHLFPHWNLKVPEGKVVPLLCYTNCDTVELFVNGTSYGEKTKIFPQDGLLGHPEPTTCNMWLDWDVAYEPGEVVAVGYKNGVEVVREVLETVGKPDHLVIECEKCLAADGRDISHVEVTVVDAKGRRVPDARVALKAKVEGQGRMIGFDSGESSSHEMFNSPYTDAIGGRALMIVQAGREAGSIRVEIEGENVGTACAEITVAQP